MLINELEQVIGDWEENQSTPSPVTRDLKINLKRLMRESSLTESEATLALFSLTTKDGPATLHQWAENNLQQLNFTPEQILEAKHNGAIMKMLNTYYRFRHMLSHGSDENVEALYGAANLRMTSLAKPQLGRASFEMLAMAHSVINGCETCIKAHEKALRDEGVAPAKIHDLARLASVVTAMQRL